MITVLVVDDSSVGREALVALLHSDPAIRVIATAMNGQEALEVLKRRQPDVITMDLHMPQMDGFEATRCIMETRPTPIVIVTGSSAPADVARTFRAMEAGALALVQRPSGFGHPLYDADAAELVRTVKLMSEVKVVRRWPGRRRPAPHVGGDAGSPPLPPRPPFSPPRAIELVAIGASTGGPQALEIVLSGLGKSFLLPILIVQHLASGFVHGFAEWLSEASGMRVGVARQGDLLLPGQVYLAPDGCQMGVTASHRIFLSSDDFRPGPLPSVSYLFHSVAAVYGSKAAAVLLTGMGKDGAEELKQLKEAGAATIAQDEESSVVHGMPGEAIKLGAASWVLPPEAIAAVLRRLSQTPE